MCYSQAVGTGIATGKTHIPASENERANVGRGSKGNVSACGNEITGALCVQFAQSSWQEQRQKHNNAGYIGSTLAKTESHESHHIIQTNTGEMHISIIL